MKSVIPAAFVLALSAATVSASEVPDRGSKGAWSWSQNIAKSEIGSGVRLMVVFSDDDKCDLAMLMVGGNTKVTELGLTVDGEFYGYTDMAHAPGTEITGVPLGPAVLKGIKHGDVAKVTTNVGSAPLSLSGSAKAINSAYGNCMERTKPIVASAPMPQRWTASESKRFGGERVRPDGSKIVALEDVVSVFGNIQIGDDVLLQELVREMENAGIPFKSVIFMKNDGGSLQAAIEMGKFIRSKGANTAVGGYPDDDGQPPHCASACVYAFAGGVQRTMYLPSRIGMHQASLMDGSDGTMEDGQTIVAVKYEYLSRMGVDPAIVIEGSKRSADDMWWLTGYEAKGYDLVTHITKPHEVSAAASRAAARHAGLPEIASTAAPSVASSVSTASTSYPDRYSSVSGPSFGCDGQLQPIEKIICEDPSLAQADGIMGAIYRDLRAALGKADADVLRAAQRGWLKQRKLTCPMSTPDLRSAAQTAEKASCLRRATDRRISELWEILRPVIVN